MAGGEPVPGLPVDPTVISGLLLALAAGAIVSAVVMAGRRREPFLDPRWFRSASFASAALVSLLTGYGFATAIIGGAVFVDRVLYGGPDLQRVALGSLAAATAGGALVSGLTLRTLGLRVTTLVGPRPPPSRRSRRWRRGRH